MCARARACVRESVQQVRADASDLVDRPVCAGPSRLYQPAREDRQRRVHDHRHLRQLNLVEDDAVGRAGPSLIFKLLLAASNVRVPVPDAADEVIQHRASQQIPKVRIEIMPVVFAKRGFAPR